MNYASWLTQSAWLALSLGVIVLAFVLANAYFYARRGFLRSDAGCVIFMWTGYHLSPWLAIMSDGQWSGPILQVEHVERGLWLSLASMVAFVVGFTIANAGSSEGNSRAARAARTISASGWVRERHLWLAAIFLIGVFVYQIGGWSEVWEASYGRGSRSWQAATLKVRIERFVNVIQPIVVLGIVVFASLHSCLRSKSQTKLLTVSFVLVAASLTGLHSMSRGAGFPFILCGAIRLATLGKSSLRSSALLFLFGFWICYVGINFRGIGKPGLGTWLRGAVASVTTPPSNTRAFNRLGGTSSLKPSQNFLSAIEPFTTVVSVLEGKSKSPFHDLDQFVFNLHPLPNSVLPLAKRGVDLTAHFGSTGKVGITTPALGDIYSTFYWWTPIFYGLLGALFAFIERFSKDTPTWFECTVLLLLFISWPVSLHSWFRSQWRLINVALILAVGFYVFWAGRNKNPRRRFSPTATSPMTTG